jgi:hypothetical protein
MARDPCFRRGSNRGTDVAPSNVVAPERETVVMNIEKKRIQEAPEYKPAADFTRDYETRLHDYYRFPYYWL